jgi:hypothetical protein
VARVTDDIRRGIVPASLIAASVLLAALVAFDVHGTVRQTLAALVFVLLPGLAVVRRLDLEPWMEVTTAICVSVTASTGIATAMLYLGFWRPGALLMALIAVTILASIRELAKLRPRAAR